MFGRVILMSLIGSKMLGDRSQSIFCTSIIQSIHNTESLLNANAVRFSVKVPGYEAIKAPSFSTIPAERKNTEPRHRLLSAEELSQSRVSCARHSVRRSEWKSFTETNKPIVARGFIDHSVDCQSFSKASLPDSDVPTLLRNMVRPTNPLTPLRK